VAFEPEMTDKSTMRNKLSSDPRKNIYNETIQTHETPPVKKTHIERNHLEEFEDFIADVATDVYKELFTEKKRKESG